ALAAADRHAGQRVLEDLLEAQELDDAQVYRWVETQTALVWTQSRVEFDAEATVDLYTIFIVNPWHAEDDLAFRFAQTLQDRGLSVFRMLDRYCFKAIEYFCDGLMEFCFAGIAAEDFVAN